MRQARFADFPFADDLAYGFASDDRVVPMALSIYADRVHLRDQIGEDATAAGFRVTGAAAVAALLAEEPVPLGEVLVLDCPTVDGASLAALTQLDCRAAHAGTALVVSTTLGALDEIFACLDQSTPQILVNPSRAERLIALGEVHVRRSARHMRDLSEEDRLVLLRLTAQVGQIAERLDRLNAPAATLRKPDAERLEAPRMAFFGRRETPGDVLVRSGAPRLPNPRMVRKMIRQRQLRARFFDGDLFADPAWDMLLDLTAARAEQTRVSVTSLCIASGVPPTTALRWIGQMTDAGLLTRVEDETDRRRAFIALTEKAVEAISRYFIELGSGGDTPV